MAALFQVTLTEEERTPCTETYLLLNKRVIDFIRTAANEVTFWYLDVSDGRDIAREFKTAMTPAAFKLLVQETDGWPNISLNISKENRHNTNTKAVGFLQTVSQTKRWIMTEFFVKAKDKPSSVGTGCYLWYNRGDFKLICVDSSNTIDEIEGAASGSGSLS